MGLVAAVRASDVVEIVNTFDDFVEGPDGLYGWIPREDAVSVGEGAWVAKVRGLDFMAAAKLGDRAYKAEGAGERFALWAKACLVEVGEVGGETVTDPAAIDQWLVRARAHGLTIGGFARAMSNATDPQDYMRRAYVDAIAILTRIADDSGAAAPSSDEGDADGDADDGG